ncbi:MAG: TIGR00159 family protein [Candidatus Omnitrophica bacterium]|nr:TIGR00159 family protein [Candidatus Omnitrophota bacterium]
MITSLLSLWRPVVEIAILWFVFYWILSFFRGTRAFQVMMGFLVLVFVLLIAQLLGLTTIDWVLTKIFAFGVIFIPIVFQPEIRRALAGLGQNTIFRGVIQARVIVDDVVEACVRLKKSGIGAIIAIERETGLKNYIESGVQIDARVSAELICTIFTPPSPLHDGGVIIQGERVASAGSLFPLTQSALVSKTLGTRHRAAIGLSEETDAVVIVISEETRSISVAVYGKLTKDVDEDGLRRILQGLLAPREAVRVMRWKLRDLLLLRNARMFTSSSSSPSKPEK